MSLNIIINSFLFFSELNSNISYAKVLNKTVSDGTIEFDIYGGTGYNQRLGLYILTGNNADNRLFCIIFSSCYESDIIMKSNANLYTNFNVTIDAFLHVTINADQINSGMDFDIQCLKITPLDK